MAAPPRRAGRPPRPAQAPWTPRQLRTRILAIFAAGALVVALHFTGLLGRLQRQVFPPRLNWSNDYSVVEHLRAEVTSDGLTHDAPDCLLFIIDGNDPPQAQRIRVMEKHNAACPGTPDQLPRLFTLRVDRAAGTVQTDAGSPGRYHPLPR